MDSPFAGRHIPDVPIFGQVVDVYATLDQTEVTRRETSGLDGIADSDVLRALMSLPLEIPIPVRTLDPLDLLALESAGPAVAEFLGSDVRRIAIPPLAILGIVKHAARWEDVQGLSLLRTHGARAALAEMPIAHRVISEADPEIGVIVRHEARNTVLRPPGVGRWVKPSWQRWLLQENAFSRWLRST